jgi:lipoyl(octanoyl) transferase
VTVEEAAPVIERHLRELLAWAPYDPTPDYDPKPEPGRAPRLIDPAAALQG